MAGDMGNRLRGCREDDCRINMNDVILKGISHSYGNTEVLKNIDLEIKEGEFFTLLGPSGCGKTTLLRILAGFITPSEGQVLIGGQDITAWKPEKRNMGIVFQNYALFPNMTVRDNIAYGLKIRRKPKQEIREKCAYHMELTGLSELADRRISELSGGQQQRVAIARALVIEPQMLLLDEPMSNLDVALRARMREEIRSIQRKTGITTLFITHDQQEALSVSDRIAVMKDGVVLQADTPKEIYNHPQGEFVSHFVGTSCLWEKEDGTTVLVRPEQLRLSRAPQCGKEALVRDVKFMGVYYEYTVEAQGREFRVIENNPGDMEEEWKPGDTGYLSCADRGGADHGKKA